MTREATKEEAKSRGVLARGAAALGVALSDEVLDKLLRYQQLLSQWNGKINLTAVRDPKEMLTHHFLDSLAVAPLLPVAPLPPSSSLCAQAEGASLVDVGAGAGFPGAVLALLRPDLKVTLVERTQKKAAFLLTVRRELGLDLRVLAIDVTTLRERFGVVISRAAFPPPEWLRVGAPLCAEGGLLLAMLSTHVKDLPPPPDFAADPLFDRHYDVGAGPRRLIAWRRLPEIQDGSRT